VPAIFATLKVITMAVISVHILLPIIKLSIELFEKFVFHFKEGNTNDFESSMFK